MQTQVGTSSIRRVAVLLIAALAMLAISVPLSGSAEAQGPPGRGRGPETTVGDAGAAGRGGAPAEELPTNRLVVAYADGAVPTPSQRAEASIDAGAPVDRFCLI